MMKTISMTTRYVGGFIGAALLTFGANAGTTNSEIELTQDIAAANLSRLVLNAHVGSVKIAKSSDEQVHVYVKVSDKEDWSLFSDSLEDVQLKVKHQGNVLQLELSEDDFGEEWIIEMPATADLDIDLGVGSVNVQGIRANIKVDVGVGEVTLGSYAQNYVDATLDTGVGGTTIDATGGNITSTRTIVSAESNWHGSGKYTITIEVGVGDASLELK